MILASASQLMPNKMNSFHFTNKENKSTQQSRRRKTKKLINTLTLWYGIYRIQCTAWIAPKSRIHYNLIWCENWNGLFAEQAVNKRKYVSNYFEVSEYLKYAAQADSLCSTCVRIGRWMYKFNLFLFVIKMKMRENVAGFIWKMFNVYYVHLSKTTTHSFSIDFQSAM